jgi:N5-(cytidine 5'-diphosphoramidyl)-L-glutamine hydrolase
MKAIGVTQRVEVVAGYGERRDCLDQAWSKFLFGCGVLPIPLPNVAEAALALCDQMQVAGLILTGGNDLAALGGDAPERDEVENRLLDFAGQRGLPVLGVCRGMQVLQHRCGIPLHRIEGHVTQSQVIRINGETAQVNSYHHFGACESRPPLDMWAVADDGVVKAVRHSSKPVTGIMWHPERCSPFRPADVRLVRELFGVK